MSRRAIIIPVATLAAIAGISQGAPSRSVIDGAHDRPVPLDVEESFGKLPLAFEINRGQFDPSVRFVARGPDYALFLTATEAVLDLRRVASASDARGEGDRSGAVVRMRLANANPAPTIDGLASLPGSTHYYRSDARRLAAHRGPGPHALLEGHAGEQHENIPSYAKVRYADVYPGVDLVYYGNQRQLEYDLVVEPGADPSVIRLAFDGVDRMEVNAAGELVLHVPGGELRQHKPILYQEMDGVRQQIDGGFVVAESRQASFMIGEYDRSLPLVIDPVLSYGTYLGGGNSDFANAIAVDAAGNAYVTGQTRSADFPLSAGLAAVTEGSYALFVTKLNATGTALEYSTYFDDGNSYNVGKRISVDAAGSAYITGQYGPGNKVVVVRLDPSGTETYGALLGDTGNNWGNGIAIDSAGYAYVTGRASSSFITTPGAYQSTSGGGNEGFVAKLNTNVSPAASLVYSTFLGGTADDEGIAIAIDASGNAYVTGNTSLGSFPVTPGAFQPTSGGGFADAFLAKLSADGGTLLYSTYFGGGFSEFSYAIAVDSDAHAYIAGYAQSSGLPTTEDAYQPAWNFGDCSTPTSLNQPCPDGFIAKFDPSASGDASLVYSTYLGSDDRDWVTSLAIDSAGNAYVGGFTTSIGGFPTVNPLPGVSSNGNGFIAELDSTGSTLLFSSYYVRPWEIALDGSGSLYLAGGTFATTGIATAGAYQTTLRGEDDAFIAKVSGFPGAPTAVNDNYTASANTTLTVPAPGVLGNDLTNGGGAMAAALVAAPASGTLTFNADGGFAYTPASGFTGTITFTYRAVNSVGSGTTATVSIVVTVPAVLRPPTNLTAAVVGNTVTISFTAPVDSIAPTGYVLEGGLTPGQALASIPTGSTATSFTFGAPDGAFYIRVHSLAGAQKSGPSNEIRIFVNVPAPPSAPANLLSLVNGSSLSLAWMNTAGGGAPTRMLLDVSGAVTATLSLPAGETASFPVVPAGTYTLAIRAENGAGTSAPSNSVTVTIPGACSGTPGTPTSFAATKSGNVITVSWQLPAAGAAPTSYLLNVTGAFTGTLPLAGRSISGAVGPGSYTLSVASTNACGTSTATAPQTVTIP